MNFLIGFGGLASLPDLSGDSGDTHLKGLIISFLGVTSRYFFYGDNLVTPL